MDGELHLFVLEGLPHGGVRRLWDELQPSPDNTGTVKDTPFVPIIDALSEHEIAVVSMGRGAKTSRQKFGCVFSWV